MTTFKVIVCRYLADIEERLNEVTEKYTNVKIEQIVYNTTVGYVIIISVGMEKHDCTYYTPLGVDRSRE